MIWAMLTVVFYAITAYGDKYISVRLKCSPGEYTFLVSSATVLWLLICLPFTGWNSKQCIAEHWDVRTLKRQKKSALFLRLAASKDKKGILELANKGAIIEKPQDIIKDVYTLEFLNLNADSHYDESELERKICANLQEFLLELGKGFTFVKEQFPMNINNHIYKCDLVFYHRILKCFVLIDLKVNAVQYDDIGQMNMYMGYFAEEENEPDDNPPIGIVLARDKDELLVKYATYGMDTNLFVSKYELYLPNREELKQLVDKIMFDEEN